MTGATRLTDMLAFGSRPRGSERPEDGPLFPGSLALAAGGTLRTNDPGKPPRNTVPKELGRRPELRMTDHARPKQRTSPERSGESPTRLTEDLSGWPR